MKSPTVGFNSFWSILSSMLPITSAMSCFFVLLERLFLPDVSFSVLLTPAPPREFFKPQVTSVNAARRLPPFRTHS